MSGAGSGTSGEDIWRPKTNPWIIAVAVSLAAFMEVLDTSIANVALPHIAGNLGATNDESTWVLTSYLISNAIVLPISGWLVGVLGRNRFFLTCIVLFTVSSFLCGIAPSLGLLLLFRVLQGAFGGGLQPMAQAILGDSFPPEKRGLAFALYGITVICAPAIGPTLGGWITDNYSWRWIFYINVPVGALAFILVIQREPIVDVRLFKSFNVATTNVMFLILGMICLVPRYLCRSSCKLSWVYGTKRRYGSFSRCSRGAGRIAHRRQTDHPIPGTLPASLWLGKLGGGHVNIVQTRRSAYGFSFGHAITCVAISPRGLFICSSHARWIRRPASGENECCCRAYEFHAQHWAERRDVGGNNTNRATQSIPSIRLGRIHRVRPVSRCD